MQNKQISRDCQRILVNSFEKRIGFMDIKASTREIKTLLKEMQHIVQTYPLDDDILDEMSNIVDRILAAISINNMYNKSKTLH